MKIVFKKLLGFFYASTADLAKLGLLLKLLEGLASGFDLRLRLSPAVLVVLLSRFLLRSVLTARSQFL